MCTLNVTPPLDLLCYMNRSLRTGYLEMGRRLDSAKPHIACNFTQAPAVSYEISSIRDSFSTTLALEVLFEASTLIANEKSQISLLSADSGHQCPLFNDLLLLLICMR